MTEQEWEERECRIAHAWAVAEDKLLALQKEYRLLIERDRATLEALRAYVSASIAERKNVGHQIEYLTKRVDSLERSRGWMMPKKDYSL